jgi:hypothetical protein
MEKKDVKKSAMHSVATCMRFCITHAAAKQATGRHSATGFAFSKRIYGVRHGSSGGEEEG